MALFTSFFCIVLVLASNTAASKEKTEKQVEKDESTSCDNDPVSPPVPYVC